MTRNDLIRMAREAGMTASVGKTSAGKYAPNVNALGKSVPIEWLEHFATQVAAAEREACAKLCDGIENGEGEAVGFARECADAIRARGAA